MMGEAKRKKDAVYHPKVPRLREYTIVIRQEDDQALREEHQRAQKKHPSLALASYMVALMNAAVENERMYREEAEASARLVQLASPKDLPKPAPAAPYKGKRS